MITFNQQQNVFHLSNGSISYLFQIETGGFPAHLYFGKAVKNYSGHYRYPRIDRSFSPNLPESEDRLFSLDTLLHEYPSFGNGDFREPACQIEFPDGSQITDFRYHTHEIFSGKPDLEGLPASYTTEETEAATLKLVLWDETAALQLVLYYTIFKDHDIITRSAKLNNKSTEIVNIRQLASCALDFSAQEFELIHLNGTWAQERNLIREKLSSGTKIIDSKRGSSSHQQSPFAALVQEETTEFQGSAFGFCLVYSGNHCTTIQRDAFQQTRFVMGIHPHRFCWRLEPQQTFQTPEAILAYSGNGLNQLSHAYHDFLDNHLIRGSYKKKQRPVLINNWEATYFDFDEEKIFSLAKEAQQLGIELFVLDDGWFGRRNNDCSSLGDWHVHPEKFPAGLAPLSKKIHDLGLKFGIWVEPEMISEDSLLYQQHPEWALQIPGRKKSPSRSQYVLDFAREDVRAYVFQQLSALFEEAAIDYVKWDMNRHLTDVYSTAFPPEQQGEIAHRYVLGLYDLLERLTKKYPSILFESCSGGGRFDAGMLYYMPQTWTSDNTDATARMNIQYSTSYVYPLSSMGAHVSGIPNHQTGRRTSLETRGNVSMAGIFGYELDLTQLSNKEKQEIKEQISFYKKQRQLLQFGTFSRLLNPYQGNHAAWQVTSPEKEEVLVFYFQILEEASSPFVTLKLTGLDPDRRYQLVQEPDKQFWGDELMKIGFYVRPKQIGDFISERYHFKAIHLEEDHHDKI